MRGAVATACALFWAQAALAHDWYTDFANPRTGEACCNVDDCKRVPPEAVRGVRAGWLVAATGEIVPYAEALKSRDRDFHICRRGSSRPQPTPGPIVCLFAPPMGG